MLTGKERGYQGFRKVKDNIYKGKDIYVFIIIVFFYILSHMSLVLQMLAYVVTGTVRLKKDVERLRIVYIERKDIYVFIPLVLY